MGSPGGHKEQGWPDTHPPTQPASLPSRSPDDGSTQGLRLLLLLPLFGAGRAALTVAGGDPETPGKCRLEGTWVNDLGSKMIISALDKEGRFTGSYLTSVSASQKPIQLSQLVGTQHLGDQPTFGLTVDWSFSDSTTVFVGQCFVSKTGEETLETTWLLREEVPSHGDDWKATRVGRNTFVRVK